MDIKSSPLLVLLALFILFMVPIYSYDLPMDVYMPYIKFDWDHAHHTEDAIDIRKNYSTDYSIPEWKPSDNRNNPFAYRMNQTDPKIKSYFECEYGYVIHKIKVEGYLNHHEGYEVFKGTIEFPNGGCTPYTEGTLTGITGSYSNVLKRDWVKYDWYIKSWCDQQGNWHNVDYHIGTTGPHTCYVLLDTPNQPWYFGSDQGKGKKEPWTDYVLDNACTWASGKSTEASAIADITIGAYNYFKNEGYDYQGGWAHAGFLDYNLSEFMDGYEYQCSDMSGFVHILLRSLGGNTKVIEINDQGGDTFWYTNYKVINDDCKGTGEWAYHSVNIFNNKISDACGKINCNEIATNKTKSNYKNTLYSKGNWYWGDTYQIITVK